MTAKEAQQISDNVCTELTRLMLLIYQHIQISAKKGEYETEYVIDRKTVDDMITIRIVDKLKSNGFNVHFTCALLIINWEKTIEN